MNNPVVYIFLNKSLKMSSGKAAAQASHASILVNGEIDSWMESIHKTIIVLGLKDDNQMRNTCDYLNQRGFNCNMIIDEGINEIEPMSITALSTDMLDKDDENVKKVFGIFKLYKSKKWYEIK